MLSVITLNLVLDYFLWVTLSLTDLVLQKHPIKTNVDSLNPQVYSLILASSLFMQDKLDSKYLLHQGHSSVLHVINSK